MVIFFRKRKCWKNFDCDEDKKHARMKISEESSEEIIIKIYHPDLIDKDKGVKIFL